MVRSAATTLDACSYTGLLRKQMVTLASGVVACQRGYRGQREKFARRAARARPIIAALTKWSGEGSDAKFRQRPPFGQSRQKSLNLVGDNSVYRTVLLIFRCPR